jgi:hypothetical protein
MGGEDHRVDVDGEVFVADVVGFFGGEVAAPRGAPESKGPSNVRPPKKESPVLSSHAPPMLSARPFVAPDAPMFAGPFQRIRLSGPKGAPQAVM